MNCESARRLIDDFMNDELNQRDRSRMEEHLAQCSRCAMELRKRPALERDVRRALAASVRPLYLSADTSARILQASEASLSRAGRAHRTAVVVRLTSGVLAFILAAVGLLAVTGRLPVPSSLKPVSLLPEARFPSSGPELSAPPGAGKHQPSMATPVLSRLETSMVIEPYNMHPGEPFTMTVYVQSNMPESMDPIGLDLDLEGPTGRYHFELAFDGPLLAEAMTIFRVTPDLLASTCEEKYLMSPAEIFGTAGTYTIRATLMNPIAASE